MKNDDKRWYVTWDGQKFGPYLEEELIGRVRNGKVDIGAYVFCEGMENWEPINTHPEFSTAFSYIPPSPTKLKFETPTNVKVSQTYRTYHQFSFMRFLFVVLFAVAGYAVSLYLLYDSGLLVLGHSDGHAIVGIIVGFILGMILFRPFKKRFRQENTNENTNSEVDSMGSKHHFPFSTILGILLTLAGLYGTYIAYEPNQWQLVLVENGKESLYPYKFKNQGDCYTWITEQAYMAADTMNSNPNMTYIGKPPVFRCRQICYDKLGCTLMILKSQ